jgi:large subunit ribosomal protein L15
MKLNELADNRGATQTPKRKGQGVGSGLGKTGGRGVKGQKSRRGVALNGFEGGQMPLHMRIPKRGFNKRNRARYVELNLGRLQAAIEAGKLNAAETITEQHLLDAGVIRRVKDGVRLLAQGELKGQVTIEVTGASAAAVAAVEALGGSVKVKAPPASPEV